MVRAQPLVMLPSIAAVAEIMNIEEVSYANKAKGQHQKANTISPSMSVVAIEAIEKVRCMLLTLGKLEDLIHRRPALSGTLAKFIDKIYEYLVSIQIHRYSHREVRLSWTHDISNLSMHLSILNVLYQYAVGATALS